MTARETRQEMNTEIEDCHYYLSHNVSIFEPLEIPYDYLIMEEDVFFCHVNILALDQYAS